jgi:hypothetical protein
LFHAGHIALPRRRRRHAAARRDTLFVGADRKLSRPQYNAFHISAAFGVRVIYYFYDEDMPIYALLVYGKNERANLTAAQRRSVAAFAVAIKATRKRR